VHLDLPGTPDEVACRAFPLTLLGSAQEWFRKLPPSSISNFEDLRRVFLSQFMAGIVWKKLARSLMTIRQGPDESLKSYLMHLIQEKLATKSQTEEFVFCALYQDIKKDGFLMADLATKPP
jgi:hypothetical protein